MIIWLFPLYLLIWFLHEFLCWKVGKRYISGIIFYFITSTYWGLTAYQACRTTQICKKESFILMEEMGNTQA